MRLTKFVFLACVVFLVVNAKPLTEEQIQAYQDLVGTCKVQEGSSDADVQEMAAHQLPSTRTGQCLHACVMENLGMIKDGKLSVEGVTKIAEMTGDATRIKNVELITKECVSTVGADRCDTANLIQQCVAKTAIALGLDPAKDLIA